MSWTPLETENIKRPIWAGSGGRIAGGSGSSPRLRCRRILSKQGMECTPVFHNLFPHSSPPHVYKQNPEEEENEKERGWEIEKETCTGALEICQVKAVKQS